MLACHSYLFPLSVFQRKLYNAQSAIRRGEGVQPTLFCLPRPCLFRNLTGVGKRCGKRRVCSFSGIAGEQQMGRVPVSFPPPASLIKTSLYLYARLSFIPCSFFKKINNARTETCSCAENHEQGGGKNKVELRPRACAGLLYHTISQCPRSKLGKNTNN